MTIDNLPARTLAGMQASLDRAMADVAAERIVAAHEVHARLLRATTIFNEQDLKGP